MSQARSHFPALQGSFAYLDNAAGAQVPRQCIDAISQFLATGSCNVGQAYPGSVKATDTKAQARLETAQFFNATPDEVVFGQSSTHLTWLLARAFSRLWGPGDEVIISELEHEANASPWRSLAQYGVTVKVWPARWPQGQLHLDDLKPLLSARTRLLALTATSNAIGSLTPVAEAIELAHSVGAWAIIDTVAYSPHHLPNVKAWDADFVFFSSYKVFGPHLGWMYVKRGLLEGLPTDKIHFIPNDALIKFEPGTASHEMLAGWLGSLAYLRQELGGGLEGRAGLEQAYRQIGQIEAQLVEQMLEGLAALPKVSLHGVPTAQGRASTFCITVEGYSPKEVEAQLVAAGIGTATGHYYAPMVLDGLGLLPDGGIRISPVHYNTSDEVGQLLEVLGRL